MMTTRNIRMGTRKQTRKVTDINVIDKKKTKVKELPIAPCYDIEHIEENEYKEDDNVENLRIEREKEIQKKRIEDMKNKKLKLIKNASESAIFEALIKKKTQKPFDTHKFTFDSNGNVIPFMKRNLLSSQISQY